MDTQIHEYIRTKAYTQHMHAVPYMHARTRMQTHTEACLYTHPGMYTLLYVHAHTCVFMCACVCVCPLGVGYIPYRQSKKLWRNCISRVIGKKTLANPTVSLFLLLRT